jgi:hypothetical protein
MILFAGWGGLQGAIVKRIDELTAKSAAKGALLFEIPVAIDGADQMLAYYENDSPQSRCIYLCASCANCKLCAFPFPVPLFITFLYSKNGRATAFCDEHWRTIKAGLNAGGIRSDIEIEECVTLLSETISNMAQKTAAKQPAKEKKLILTIPVLVDEKNIVMKVSLPLGPVMHACTNMRFTPPSVTRYPPPPPTSIHICFS